MPRFDNNPRQYVDPPLPTQPIPPAHEGNYAFPIPSDPSSLDVGLSPDLFQLASQQGPINPDQVWGYYSRDPHYWRYMGGNDPASARPDTFGSMYEGPGTAPHIVTPFGGFAPGADPDPRMERNPPSGDPLHNPPRPPERELLSPDDTTLAQNFLPGMGPLPGKLNRLTQYENLGNIRPFGPGEYVNNPNGSVSSELSMTVPMGNQWAVVPSLWMVNGVPTRVDWRTAVQYAQQSGLTWPMFDSENWANQYARHRETVLNRPGMGTGAMEPLWSRPWPPR